MAKKKLIRFDQLKDYPNVVQPQMDEFWDTNFRLKGTWKSQFFKNQNPLVLELACGKGEYTVAMAQNNSNKNFLGVDIKGARIWYGATKAIDENLENAKFLRTRIDFIDKFFLPGEVNEIWITFPDPQPQESRERKRLTSPMFINRYKKILKPGGIIHLKTDADSLFQYTLEQISLHNYGIVHQFTDVYLQREKIPQHLSYLYSIQTHYETIFSAKGHTIKYVSFTIH